MNTFSRTGVLAFIIMMWSTLSWGSADPLVSHLQATAKTMSALYMKSLTHGSDKYQRDVEAYKAEASQALQQWVESGDSQAASFSAKWASLAPVVMVEYTEKYEWDVDEVTRRDFRTYLSDLFAYANGLQSRFETTSLKSQWASAQVDTMVARFFDISTSYNGTISLSPLDAEKVNLKVIAAEFQNNMDYLGKLQPERKKSLDSALFKWRFVEESVVNYSDASAHFLVYATTNKIRQALSQNLQVSAN